MHFFMMIFHRRSPVAQWVERWPADLAVLRSIPGAANILNRNRGSIAHNISLSPFHLPDMTDITLKERKILSNPSINTYHRAQNIVPIKK